MSFPLANIQERISAVDAIIQEALPTENETIAAVADYLIGSGGKRLRSLLVLHYGQALAPIDDKLLNYAAIIELIHAATLLHDDIVDDAQLRRGRLTANKNWSNAASVLSGDYLYAKALQMAVLQGSMEVLTLLTTTVQSIAVGEIEQLDAKKQRLERLDYLRIIGRKTASLFACACAGAFVFSLDAKGRKSKSGKTKREDQFAAAFNFGYNFGMAFQIIDDVLDYRAIASELGKNPGQDYREGKHTLPLIMALERGSTKQLLSDFANPEASLSKLQQVASIMEKRRVFTDCYRFGEEYIERSRQNLQALPASEPRAALSALLQVTTERCF